MKTRILHISDIHFRRDYSCPSDAAGYQKMLCTMQSPLIPLDFCLGQALSTGEKPDLVAISGDLTEAGEEEDYRFLVQHMKKWLGAIPLLVTLGNHDKKENFRTGWLGLSEGSCEPYNQIEKIKDLTIISFDSSQFGKPDGWLPKEQYCWLAEAMDSCAGGPAILLTHHHLLPGQGPVPPLAYAPEFLQLLEQSSLIGILCGHTHHQLTGRLAGKWYCTAGSMSFCGLNQPDGSVQFEETFGYHIYEIENGSFTSCHAHTFTTGRNIGSLD